MSSSSIQPRLDGSTAPAATSSEQRSALESMLADLRVRHWRPGSMPGHLYRRGRGDRRAHADTGGGRIY
ncbi:MAG: hypothetical protein E6J22_15065 [Chloroflexi bacterium]|nr:MAG: hypothetical protein E6J22_15065 [Chloroflexota bacterium]